MDYTVCEVIQEAGKLIAKCPTEAEGFSSLFKSLPHWEFELMLELLSAAFGIAVWPFICRGWKAALKRWLHKHDQCCASQETDSVQD